MHNVLVRMEKLLSSPYVRLLVGVLLIASGLSEALETVEEDLRNHSLKGSHGVVILGLFQTLEAITGILKVFLKKTSDDE